MLRLRLFIVAKRFWQVNACASIYDYPGTLTAERWPQTTVKHITAADWLFISFCGWTGIFSARDFGSTDKHTTNIKRRPSRLSRLWRTPITK
jgi:hypothetical protein